MKTAVVTAATGAGGAGAVLNASGYVTARRRATVSSKVTGKVLEVFVEEGKAVKKGQVLARLDDSQVRAALAARRGAADAARGAARGGRSAAPRGGADSSAACSSCVQEKVVGQAEVDTAQRRSSRSRRGSRSRSSRSRSPSRRSRAATTDLDDMVVRAPFNGVAISKDAQPGEMISPVSAGGGFTRTGICTIVDMSSLEIEVDVNESYINRVRPSQPVEAVLDAYPDWRIPAHVITTVPTADRQKATVRVRIGVRGARSADPARHGRQGVVPATSGRPRQPARAGASRGCWCRRPRCARDGRQSVVFVVRDDRVERRAVSDRRRQTAIRSRCSSGVDTPASASSSRAGARSRTARRVQGEPS